YDLEDLLFGDMSLVARIPGLGQRIIDKPEPLYYESLDTSPKEFAREKWRVYMDRNSHGLSVSDLPVFVYIQLPGSIVDMVDLLVFRAQSRTGWDQCTEAFRQRVSQWTGHPLTKKASAQKALGAFSHWTYSAFVEL